MQSLVVDVKTTGALLFVRSVKDLPGAIRAVNEIFSRRRSVDAPREEVLGIVVRRDLDACLAEPSCDHVTTAVRLRQSAARSGIWSLCWFDFTGPEGRGSAERRRQLLDLLPLAGPDPAAAGESRSLLPVLTSAEAPDDVERLVEHLAARYPTLTIGPDCFVQDAERRRLVLLERQRPAPGTRRPH